MREADAHVARAREALRAGRLALEAGLYLDAVSRAYYAMYHGAHALLASIGESSRTHKGLILKTREHFADRLGAENVQALARMQGLREHSDYEVGVALEEDEAADACQGAQRFLDAVEETLSTEAGSDPRL